MIKKSIKKTSVKKPSSVKATKTVKSVGAKNTSTKKKTNVNKVSAVNKKVVAKKATTKSIGKKTSAVKKTTAKKPVITPAKKVVSKKAVAKKTAVNKTAAKKVPVKKPVVAKKSTTKASAKRAIAKTKVVENTRAANTPLIIEPYPKDYTGLPFLTLIQFRRQPMLVIVDNVDDDLIRAYVLDLCGPAHVDEERIVLTAAEWFSESRSKYPISIEFSKRGLTAETSKIYRTFDIEFVSRVIGPAPEFPMGATKSVRRRRRKPVPAGVEVVKSDETITEGFFV